MHISDGILSAKICAAGYAGAALVTGYALKKIKNGDIPRVSVISAVFFISSLLHFRVGPSSVHLLLLGIVGILLGPLSPLVFFTGLFFQFMMFSHGGITTLGINTVIFSIPSLLIYSGNKTIFKKTTHTVIRSVTSGVLTATGIFFAAFCILLIIYFSAKQFIGIAFLFSASHAVLAVFEGAITGLVINRILKVKPELLAFLC